MSIINKKYLIIMGSILLVITTILVIKQTKPVELDEVKLLEASNNTSFAMYKEDGEVYTEVEGNTFPEGYVLNINKSKCIDNNGNEVNDVLNFDNYQVKLTSNKTTYCYLYFDESLGLEIKNKNPNKLSTEVKGDMYRFQGKQEDNVENYICFGTSDKQTCLDHPDQYMYRIIGIEAKTGRVKILKRDELNQPYQWYTDYNTDIKLPDSLFFNAINEEDFLDNPTYIPEGWKDKISDNTWYYGDTMEIELGQDNLYEKETGKMSTKWYNYASKDTPNAKNIVASYEGSPHYQSLVYYTDGEGEWDDTINAKISLIYVHDYSLSLLENNGNCYSNQNENCHSWLTNDIKKFQWLMTRYGWAITSGWYDTYSFLFGSDDLYLSRVNLSFSGALFYVRPTFYIDAYQSLKNGTGKIDDPFIIA